MASFELRAGWRSAALAALLGAGCAMTPGPRSGEALRDCADCPELVVVPRGEFLMGAEGGEPGRPEGPVRRVRIDYALAVGRYEVTQAQYARFVADTGRPTRGGCRVWQAGAWAYPEDADWTNPGYEGIPWDDDPVACVSWHDAVDYADWLSARTGRRYRLLSEAEWEYVARAGTATDYFWGNDPAGACDYANVYDASGAAMNGFDWPPFPCDDGFGRAAPVGSFLPNPFGLYDVIGNVWEWTADCYVAPYPPAPADGRPVEAGACDRRVSRGGSWITRASRQRAAFRGRDPEDTLFAFFGFRVAREL